MQRYREHIDTNDVMRRLAKLAFIDFVQNVRITEDMINRVMKSAFKGAYFSCCQEFVYLSTFLLFDKLQI